MNSADFVVHLDQLSSSYLVILFLLLIVIAAGVLFRIGFIMWAVTTFAALVRKSIQQGFLLWELLFAWASWTTFLTVVLSSLFAGWLASRHAPALTVVFAVIPLFMGVTACLAYMFIDLERYAVSRGYKCVHNPLRGQELARNLVRYGHAVGIPLLVTATLGMVGGFALLNFGLYATIGRSWYAVAAGQAEPTYVDFVANALIVLLRIIDVLDFAKASHLLDVSYVRQCKWPSSALLAVFRMFFTVVLLQQVFASFRRGQVLSETITDLWNPNEPIHERASHALPQHGPGAVGPLLISLGNVTSLTKEQRERLPVMLADIGPAAIPSLIQHLRDEHEHVRAISTSALGHLRIRSTVVLLVPLSRDSSDLVRQSLSEALGNIASPGSTLDNVKVAFLSPRELLSRLLKFKRRPSVHGPVIEPVKLAVETLQAALWDESLVVRAQAARSLGRIGPLASDASASLILLFKDEDETVRQAAIEAITKVGGQTTDIVNALVEVLQDSSPELRTAAARGLAAFGEAASSAFSSLAPLLQDREAMVRDAVAEAIGQIGHLDDQATDELVGGLTSPDNVVRAQTAEALGTIGETAQEAAPALVEALTDRNDSVRAAAVEALGKIGEAAADVAVPGLVRALRDQDNVVSSLAAEALGEMGESANRAIPSLLRSMDHINADVRASAAESLGKLGMNVADAAIALIRACRDEDAVVRKQAMHSLGMLESPTRMTKSVILDGLSDLDAQVRTTALEALCRWGLLEETALELLLPLLEDPNEQVRAEVTAALPRLAGPTPVVIQGLCDRLRDDTDLVQERAATALGECGSAASAAGVTLLHSAQFGAADVREAARNAIVLIRPSEHLDSIDQNEIDASVISAFIEIENQTLPDVNDIPIDVIPVVVTGMIDSNTGLPANSDFTMEVVAVKDLGKMVEQLTEMTEATEFKPQD